MLIHLKTPIEIKGETIRAIQMRQPGKAARKRISAAQGGEPLAQAIEMVSALTGLTTAQIEELEPADFHNVTEAAIAYVSRRA